MDRGEPLPPEGEAQGPAITGLIGELKYQSSLFDGIELGRQSLGALGDRGESPSTAEAWLLWCLRPGVRVVHASRLEQMHQLIEYARLQPFERQARRLRLPSDESKPMSWNRFTGLAMSGLGRAVQSGDEHRALTTLAATAVALRRFRLDRGRYPASLDELVPAFLPRVLVDPYTGRAPDYRRVDAGFELRVNTPAKEPVMVDLFNWRIAR